MEAIDNILNIDQQPIFNNSIQKENLIKLAPTSGSSLNDDGEINFVIETYDQYLLPSKSFLYIEGNLTKLDNAALTNADKVTLTNNAPLFLFDSISYSLGGNIIEKVKDPGRASLMKGILSYSSNLSKQNTFGWILDNSTSTNYKIEKYTDNMKGKLSFCIPLSHIFGFAECYNKVIYGASHSLSLYRNSHKKNDILSTDTTNFKAKFSITKINYFYTKIEPSLESEIKLNKIIDTKKSFKIPFLSRQFEEINVPVATKDFTWQLGVKYDKVKYFIIGFQTKRENNYLNAAVFDHCNLETIYVELNSERYPHECIICNFTNLNAVQQYIFAKDFKNSYFQTIKDCIFIEETHYSKYYPLFVIDVSKQNNKIIDSRPDITIQANFSKSIPVDTKAYCLVLSEKCAEISGFGSGFYVKV